MSWQATKPAIREQNINRYRWIPRVPIVKIAVFIFLLRCCYQFVGNLLSILHAIGFFSARNRLRFAIRSGYDFRLTNRTFLRDVYAGFPRSEEGKLRLGYMQRCVAIFNVRNVHFRLRDVLQKSVIMLTKTVAEVKQ